METPSFTFRLERVRTIRERAEDRAREALTVELRNRAEGEALLRDAADAVTAARDHGSQRPSPSGRISATDFISAQAFLERTERLRVEASLELSRREAEVDAAPRGARRRGPRPPGHRQAQGAPEGRARRGMGASLAEHARRARARRPPPGRRSHRMSIEAVMSRVSQIQAMLASAQAPMRRGTRRRRAEVLLDRARERDRHRRLDQPRPRRPPRAAVDGDGDPDRAASFPPARPTPPRSPPRPRPTASTPRCWPA